MDHWLRLPFPVQEVWVWSLVRELRFQMPHAPHPQKKKPKGNRSSIVANSIKTLKIVHIKKKKQSLKKELWQKEGEQDSISCCWLQDGGAKWKAWKGNEFCQCPEAPGAVFSTELPERNTACQHLGFSPVRSSPENPAAWWWLLTYRTRRSVCLTWVVISEGNNSKPIGDGNRLLKKLCHLPVEVTTC